VPGPAVRAIWMPGSLEKGESELKVTTTSGNWIVHERLDSEVVGREDTRGGTARRRGKRDMKYMIGLVKTGC
jgi:hypothetical protein